MRALTYLAIGLGLAPLAIRGEPVPAPERDQVVARSRQVREEASRLMAEIGNIPFHGLGAKPDLAEIVARGPVAASLPPETFGPRLGFDEDGLEAGQDLLEQGCWIDFLGALLEAYRERRPRPATLFEVPVADRYPGSWLAAHRNLFGFGPPPSGSATRRTLVFAALMASGRMDRPDMASARTFVKGVAEAWLGHPSPVSPEAVEWLAARLGRPPQGSRTPSGVAAPQRSRPESEPSLPGPAWLLGMFGIAVLAMGVRAGRWKSGTGDTTQKRVGAEATEGTGAVTVPGSQARGAAPRLPERYAEVRLVASGGMGEIYRAEDLRLGRTVAIKMVGIGEDPSGALVERFHREARALARLDHPGIVRIHDMELGERPWLVMEFLEGETLEAWRKARAKVDAVEVARIGIELLEALGHAHDHGVLHRDLKPSNVVRLGSGAHKLVDFGIARLLDSSTLTSEGAILGTAAYMSPEQIQGKLVDRRSDLWSVGAVLYRLLAGRPPFEGVELMARVFRLPEPASQVAPEVGGVLDGILARAMAVRAEERYPDARGFAEALRRVSEPVVTGTEGPTELG